MQKIAETVGEFLKGDWGRSRLITGGGGLQADISVIINQPHNQLSVALEVIDKLKKMQLVSGSLYAEAQYIF